MCVYEYIVFWYIFSQCRCLCILWFLFSSPSPSFFHLFVYIFIWLYCVFHVCFPFFHILCMNVRVWKVFLWLFILFVFVDFAVLLFLLVLVGVIVVVLAVGKMWRLLTFPTAWNISFVSFFFISLFYAFSQSWNVLYRHTYTFRYTYTQTIALFTFSHTLFCMFFMLCFISFLFDFISVSVGCVFIIWRNFSKLNTNNSTDLQIHFKATNDIHTHTNEAKIT